MGRDVHPPGDAILTSMTCLRFCFGRVIATGMDGHEPGFQPNQMKASFNTPDDQEPEAPELPVAFDEEGRPVATTDPIYEPPTDEPDRTHMLTAAVLDFALIGMNLEAVAERNLFVAYLMKTPRAPKTLRDLGTRLGCSHVVAGRRVNRFKRQLAEELKNFAPRC